MAYDEYLGDRIAAALKQKHVKFAAKKMMGGLCFMVNDKMCVGIVKDCLMARVGPDNYTAALAKPGCKQMDFTGRPMQGYVFVEPAAIDTDTELDYWIDLCLQYNPQAKASKKK